VIKSAGPLICVARLDFEYPLWQVSSSHE